MSINTVFPKGSLERTFIGCHGSNVLILKARRT